MKSKLFFGFMLWIMIALLLTACASIALTQATAPRMNATEAKLAATMPSPLTQTALATNALPSAQPTFQNALVYGVPEMDKVVVRNVEYSRFANTPLTMDIYYPPDMASGARLPVVIFVFGFPDPVAEQLGGTKLKDFAQYLSWGRLAAASGLIAVTYETQQPDADLEAVIAFIQQHAASLHMDADRLGLWACSANVPTALSFVMQASREDVELAVFYYGQMLTPDQKYREQIDAFGQELGFYSAELKDVEQLRPDLPLFIVRAGLDEVPWVKASMDHFVSVALTSNVPLSVINYAEGVHGFDTDLANAQSREIVQQTLAFMQTHLAEE